MSSIEIREDRSKGAFYNTSSVLLETWENKYYMKRWQPSGAIIVSGAWTPSYRPQPSGSFTVTTHQIWRTRRRLATTYDNPSQVGFTKRKKLGLYIPPHPYTSRVEWGVVQTIYGVPPGGSVSVAGMPGTFSRAFTGDIDIVQAASDAAVAKFWAAARNRTVVESGVLIAELRGSIGMASNAVLTVLEIIRALKKGRFDKAVEALIKHGQPISRSTRQRFRNYSETSGMSLTKWVASAWLELQFGWKPLLQDVYNLMEVTTDRMNGEYFPTLTLRGKGPTLTLRKDSYTEYDINTGSGMDDTVTNCTVRADASITALFRVDSSLTIANALGLDNPAAIAWELVPFSFVIDWFLPIGRYLSNLSALNGLTLVHATEFRRVIRRCERFTTERRSWGYSLVAEHNDVYYTRQVLNTIPPENFEIPNLSKLIDGWKFTTALSLLEQRRSRT